MRARSRIGDQTTTKNRGSKIKANELSLLAQRECLHFLPDDDDGGGGSFEVAESLSDLKQGLSERLRARRVDLTRDLTGEWPRVQLLRLVSGFSS